MVCFSTWNMNFGDCKINDTNLIYLLIWNTSCNRGKGGKNTKLIYSERSAQLSVESIRIITISEITWHAVDWYFGSKGDLKGFHAVIRHNCIWILWLLTNVRSTGGSVSMCDSIWMYLGQQAKQE